MVHCKGRPENGLAVHSSVSCGNQGSVVGVFCGCKGCSAEATRLRCAPGGTLSWCDIAAPANEL
eukprot:5724203-Prymnesium_polylepis.2